MPNTSKDRKWEQRLPIVKSPKLKRFMPLFSQFTIRVKSVVLPAKLYHLRQLNDLLQLNFVTAKLEILQFFILGSIGI